MIERAWIHQDQHHAATEHTFIRSRMPTTEMMKSSQWIQLLPGLFDGYDDAPKRRMTLLAPDDGIGKAQDGSKKSQ
jgi:hypothetical protein